jgi:acetyl esterase/lipase
MTLLHRIFVLLALAVVMGLTIPFARATDQFSKRDLVFNRVAPRDLLLDIYYPKIPPPPAGYPLIVSIHGGAWAYADRYNDLNLLNLTSRGYALASIDYRLSGEAQYPAQIEDARQAVRWLVANADSLHVDTNKIVATGISAGGHLALLLGLSQPPGHHMIKAVCALYAPTDLLVLVPEELRDQSTNAVAVLLGGPVSQRLSLARDASPISYTRKGSIPIMLFHGEKDQIVPVAQSMALDAALKAVGAQSTLIVYKDKGHAFGLDDAALRKVGEFYERSLNGPLH